MIKLVGIISKAILECFTVRFFSFFSLDRVAFAKRENCFSDVRSFS